MTIEAIVIPKFETPYDITYHCHTRCSHIHTLSRIYTQRHCSWASVFQVFSSKTCWLLSTSFNRLLVTVIFTNFSRYSAKISRNSNPFARNLDCSMVVIARVWPLFWFRFLTEYYQLDFLRFKTLIWNWVWVFRLGFV